MLIGSELKVFNITLKNNVDDWDSRVFDDFDETLCTVNYLRSVDSMS